MALSAVGLVRFHTRSVNVPRGRKREAPRRVQCPEEADLSSHFGAAMAGRNPLSRGRGCAFLALIGLPGCAHQRAFPSECMGHDRGQIVETRLPAQRRTRLLGICDDACGIAGAARRDIDFEIDARDALNHFAQLRTPKSRGRSRNSASEIVPRSASSEAHPNGRGQDR